MKMKLFLSGIVVMFVSANVLAENPAISGVIVQQRWPWSRLVDIDYVLECDRGQLMDVTVSAYDGTVPLDVPEASFSGDLFAVQCGARRIVWDPTMTDYAIDGVLPKFRVSLTPTPVPLYMIVDLTKSAGESGQTEYVYESELTNGVWGAWVRNPVTNDGAVVESVIWTGVITNDIYKTDKLVLRRISKGSFEMGGVLWSKRSTTLTKDFYAGVFQVTQRQWELITGANRSRFNNPDYYMTRPSERVSYNAIRGATDSVPAIDWPGTGTLVEPSSFVGLLRAKTGLTGFDLPTEAQWEYACRAGTTTEFNDGNAAANVEGDNANTNAWLNVLGRYRYNGGVVWNSATSTWDSPPAECGPENATATVGSYLPNAWGLYDVYGNVMEWCLDYYDWSLVGGKDPTGPAESSTSVRVLRGGSWSSFALHCCSAYRYSFSPSDGYMTYGFRLVRTLP